MATVSEQAFVKTQGEGDFVKHYNIYLNYDFLYMFARRSVSHLVESLFVWGSTVSSASFVIITRVYPTEKNPVKSVLIEIAV